MIIEDINRILNEGWDLTKLSADPDGKTGKGADAIALGAAQPYKKKDKSPLEKLYPALATSVERVKKDGKDVLLSGASLIQANMLYQTASMGKDDDGSLILPFGYNVRVFKKGKQIYIGLKKGKKAQNEQPSADTLKELMEIV